MTALFFKNKDLYKVLKLSDGPTRLRPDLKDKQKAEDKKNNKNNRKERKTQR